MPPAWAENGSAEHLLGTDALGRDYFMRLLLGAQTSFKVSGLAVLLSCYFGVVIGLLAGYAGKTVETLLMRLADIQLAFPFIILCIALLSVLQPTLLVITLVLAVADWVIYARLARGRTLLEKEQEYTLAARGDRCAAGTDHFPAHFAERASGDCGRGGAGVWYSGAGGSLAQLFGAGCATANSIVGEYVG